MEPFKSVKYQSDLLARWFIRRGPMCFVIGLLDWGVTGARSG